MKSTNYKFDDIFSACIKGKKDRVFTEIEKKQNNYLRAAHKIFKLYGGYQIYYVYNDLSALYGWDENELRSMYDKLRRKESAGRKYYEKLREVAVNGKCQICMYGSVESLDHYLPKESYPSLAISAHNLIPSCISCNGKKSTHKPKSLQDQTIHFKFDSYFKSNWLEAYYNHNLRRITFFPNKSMYSEGSVDQKRIMEHLRVHELYELYEVLALKEIREIVVRASKNDLSLKETVELERDLVLENEKYSPGSIFTLNQWRLATFEALLKSEYFLRDGMNMLDDGSFFQPSVFDFE
jgi:hypothetical protein